MTSLREDSSMSAPDRVWRFLRGPRFVDLPIRLLALILCLTVLVPGSFEITEPRYVALLIGAYALFVFAPFLPLVTALVSTGLSIVFVALYPDLENMFPEVLIFAVAVLLSHRRWIGAAIATTGLVAYLLTATELGAYDGGVAGFIDLGFGWLTYSLIGAAAGFVELRIHREILRRERAAVDHQKTVESMRTRFTSDMHDTISNSLATESAIIRTMAREGTSPDSDRLLAELALVNAEATKRLRHLVGSLRSGEPQDSRFRLHAEAEQLAAAIDSGCSAGSVPLSIHMDRLPKYASADLGRHFTAIVLELATNVIRYSAPGSPASLEVEMRAGSDDRAELVCRSRNEAPAGLPRTPRSLDRRATAVNGTCRVLSAEGQNVIVEVAVPVRYVRAETGGSRAEAGGTHSERSESRGSRGESHGSRGGSTAAALGQGEEIAVLCDRAEPVIPVGEGAAGGQRSSEAQGRSARPDDSERPDGADRLGGSERLGESGRLSESERLSGSGESTGSNRPVGEKNWAEV
ncbi:MAG: hypothetical protein ACTH2U_04665 [Brevibacterium sp.]